MKNQNQIILVFEKYSTININGMVYGGSTSRAKTSSIVMVEVNNELRPAKIHYFVTVSALINSLPKNHVLVYLSCYKHHPDKESRSQYGKVIFLNQVSLYMVQSNHRQNLWVRTLYIWYCMCLYYKFYHIDPTWREYRTKAIKCGNLVAICMNVIISSRN